MITIFTPLPASQLVHQMFAKGGSASEPEHYRDIKSNLKIEKNLTYTSLIPQNKYDLALPKSGENFPVIIWVHGGAYVGGQKEDVEIYTNTLAAEGYAVVNFEYDLAPGTRYPGPLIQLSNLYQELLKVAPKYSLNMEKLIFAGDSAGGQIAAQFVNLQVADQGSKNLAYLKTIPAKDIKGTILFCAPLSLSSLTENKSSFVTSFIIKRIAWAYSGEANLSKSNLATEADLVKSVSPNFPATFISDGNHNSFEGDNKAFAKKLEAQGTKVSTAFYSPKEGELNHEYQLDFKLPQAQETYKSLVSFLKSLD